jgi:hypothetical protein
VTTITKPTNFIEISTHWYSFCTSYASRIEIFKVLQIPELMPS